MNVELPLVSVILPTYNRADIIVNSVQSVLDQTYENIELIVVDDGSTDNTENVLSVYGDKIKYIKQTNKGVSAARNAGISISSGDYIAFIDSDDIWRREKLELQVAFFNEHEADNVVMVSTDVVVVNIDGSVKNRRRLIKRDSSCLLGFIDVFKDPYLGLPTVMLKRKFIDTKCLFDENLTTAEDLDLYLKLSVKHNVGYIHKKLVEVHKTEGSLSECADSYSDNIFVVKRFIENNVDIFEKYQKVITNVLYRIIYDYSKTLLWNGNNKECRNQLKASFQYKITPKALILYLKSLIPSI